MHLACVQVEAGDIGHQHADVAAPLEDRPERIADLAGRKGARRDLVGEWLEEVEVAPVDERDLHRAARKVLGGLEAAEPAADHHDPVPVGFHPGSGYGCAEPGTESV